MWQQVICFEGSWRYHDFSIWPYIIGLGVVT
nr:MAG TPA: endonuclease [Caudoviricetes sp.]